MEFKDLQIKKTPRHFYLFLTASIFWIIFSYVLYNNSHEESLYSVIISIILTSHSIYLFLKHNFEIKKAKNRYNTIVSEDGPSPLLKELINDMYKKDLIDLRSDF